MRRHLFFLIPLSVPLSLGVFGSQGTQPTQSFEPTDIQRIHSPLWRMDGSFDPILHVQNGLSHAPLEVVPVVYAASGEALVLDSLWLPAKGTAQLDLATLVQQQSPGRRWSPRGFGSAELRYRHPDPGAVTGSIRSRDPVTRVVSTMPFVALPQGESAHHVMECVWWRDEPDTDVFAVVANTTDRTVPVTVIIMGRDGRTLARHSLIVQRHATDLRRLVGLSLAPFSQGVGGVRVEFDGEPGDILAAGGIENRRTGYSADLPFWYRRPWDRELTFAAPGLLAGAPDPALGFAKGTRFVPFLHLRNTLHEPTTVEVSLRINQSPEPIDLRFTESLPPLQAETVDLQAALVRAGFARFNGSLDLSVSFHGGPGAVVLGLGSVDESGDFVLQSHPHGVEESGGKRIPYWSAEHGDQTMIAVWNHGSAATEFALNVHYESPRGDGYYRHLFALEGGASTILNLGDLIARGVPDADGNRIPIDATGGTAQLENALGPDRTVAVSVGAGTLNVAAGTCSWWCIWCEGYLYMQVTADDTNDVLVGNETIYYTAEAKHVSSGWYDYTSSSTWTSANSGVSVSGGRVTASTYLTTPVAITAMRTLPPFYSSWCAYNPLCPSGESFQGSATAKTRQPKWAVLSDQSDETGLCPFAVAKKNRFYQAYDDFGQIQKVLPWTLIETVTSSSDCGVGTGGSDNKVTFHDAIQNCTTNCTFRSNQTFQIYGATVKAKDCPGCGERTGWRVTATTQQVTVEIY